jgi:hypothetical protein
MEIELTPEELEKLYIRYASYEVSHNTMTRGEFFRKIEDDEVFLKRFYYNCEEDE